MFRRLLQTLPLLLVTAVASTARADDAVGRVSLVEGTVQRDVAGSRSPLVEGEAIAEGDHLMTAGRSRAELILADGSVVRLGPDSDLTLSKLAFEEKTETLTAKLHLALGKLWTHVEKVKEGGSYEVETDRAVAGVRGTEFRVDASEEAHAVEVYEGKVHVRPVLLALNERTPSPARPAIASQAASPASPPAAASASRAIAPARAPGAGELDLVPGKRVEIAGQQVSVRDNQPPDEFSKFAKREIPDRERRRERMKERKQKRQERRLDRGDADHDSKEEEEKEEPAVKHRATEQRHTPQHHRP
jgi:hypothetical protein